VFDSTINNTHLQEVIKQLLVQYDAVPPGGTKTMHQVQLYLFTWSLELSFLTQY